jgi:hypothetical protein
MPVMKGIEFDEFQKALIDAFDQQELARMVRVRLNERLSDIVEAGPTKHVVFQLLEWVEREGIEAELAHAAYLERPRNDKVRIIYGKFGLSPNVVVQKSGQAVPAAPVQATAAALEALVRPRLKLVDLGVWREQLARIEGQVCRIEFNGNPRGTGFLVGADLVLTNYHVLEKLISGELPAGAVGCRFDYKVLVDGSRAEGALVQLHPTEWLADQSRFSRAEGENQPDRELPTIDELDFALVRVARAIGNEPVGKNTSGASPRGYIATTATQPPLEKDMPLLIAQHPNGSPLKLALDTQGVIKVNENGTRVRYATNTEHGSSGSPCFNIDWTLVALHHMGDPAWLNPQFNEGVPVGMIRTRLEKKGITALGT